MSDEREELAQWCERHAEQLKSPVHQEGATYTSHLRQTAKKFRRIATILRADAGWRPIETAPKEKAMADVSALERDIAAVLHDPHGAPVIMNIFRAYLASDEVVLKAANAKVDAAFARGRTNVIEDTRAALAAIME